jgi:hypothetical protein
MIAGELELKKCGLGEITISLEVPYRKDVVKFFIEVVENWLLPGGQLHISKFESHRDVGNVVCTAVIIPSSVEEADRVCENFTLLEDEIKLGMASAYHAKKLLELKGLFFEEKESLVREGIREKVVKFPQYFDYDIFTLMQKILVTVSETYKTSRSCSLLERIICNCYLISQKIQDSIEIAPNDRYFFLKIVPIFYSTPFGEKMILGCFVGMNFLKKTEVLEDRHILRAVRKYFPEVNPVQGSCFMKKTDKSLLCYLELEQEESFTFKEIALLKKELKEQVKNSIETLLPPVFMPRNEEEVMKYIVTLSQQVTSVKDLPQVVIMFNEQTEEDLLFTLLMGRPLFENGYSIEKILRAEGFQIEIEKVRHAGALRKNVSKEVCQIKISIPKAEFLREDFALDLYKARQMIVSWLERQLGPIRDYNGGMISRRMA